VVGNLGDNKIALTLSEEALCLHRELFGEKHPYTAMSLSNVAGYYESLGNTAKALELGEQALQIRRKLLGEDHPDTVQSNYNLIVYLLNSNQRPVAFERLQHQLALLKKDHPQYEKFTRLREQLSSKPLRNGFRQPPKNPHKSKAKKRH
jgi:tetratricopeptide (TPR) repeat protein